MTHDLDKICNSRIYFKEKLKDFPMDIQEKLHGILAKLNHNSLIQELTHSIYDECEYCESCGDIIRFISVDEKLFNYSITPSFRIEDQETHEEILMCSHCTREELSNWL